MTECKGYKFKKGEPLGSSSSGDGGNLTTTEYRYHLRITDNKGTVIAEVDPSDAQYITKVSHGFLWDTTNEYLQAKGLCQNLDIKDFSIKFQNGKFVITGISNNCFAQIDSFTLTGDGKELLSECFPSAQEYHVPPYNYTNHSFDHEYNEPYVDLATDLDLL